MRIRVGRSKLATAAVATIGVLLFLPAVAQAADAYVDFETGDDTAPCGDMADPCQTVVTGISTATATATVRVDDRLGTGSYFEMFGHTLGNGKSLVAEEFVDGDEGSLAEPDTIIEGGEVVTFSPSITVPPGAGAGTIEGFRIRSQSNATPVLLEAPATLTGNTIDEDEGTITGCLVEVRNSGNTATIGPGNSFVDPTPTAGAQGGVCITFSATPTISSNTFTDLSPGVQSRGGDATIESNVFTGTRGTISDAAIEVTSGAPTVTANVIQSPGDAVVGGIVLQQTGNTIDVGATLRRNTIVSHRVGVVANNTEFPVSLNGDLITKSAQVGLSMGDGDNDGDGNVTATNITIADSLSTDVSVSGADLTLSSSLLGSSGPGIIASGDSPTCAITFSRGPVMTAGGNGCANFQTTATPGFVDPDTDHHLAPGSPMIDMGDPAAPLGGVLDLDGQARATDGNGDGIVRRDIGADETATVPPTPPSPPANPAPPGQPTKKCKKKRKKKGASAAKKKRCKKKRKK